MIAHPGPRVLLLGMMGAGKTTVGHALEERTGWPYLDNDELVRRVAGTDTPSLLHERGVAELRRAEEQALHEALRAPVPVVAAVAGGVVSDPDNRRLLRTGGFVVWLRARLQTLAERVRADPPRPWLHDDPLPDLERLYAGRAPLYAEVASLVVDVDDLGPDEVAARIVEAVAAEPPG